MKLTKKVIFSIVAGFFAVATVFNMSMLNENGAGDVSLDAVAVMAEAGGETGDNGPWLCVYFPEIDDCAWFYEIGLPCTDC